jgi:exosome complex protein LRP1
VISADLALDFLFSPQKYDLEEQIYLLLTQSLPETLSELDTIEQAKLQTLLPYLIYDLVFVYLKTKGIDPKTHPVVGELDRIRGYFDKISNAESSQTKRTTVDKEAAGRFIKHAIAQTEAHNTVSADEGDGDTKNSPHVPVKVTKKMLERQWYEKQLQKEDEEEEQDLTIFENSTSMDVDEQLSSKESRKKSKRKPKEQEELLSSTSKRRRAQIDPFTGELNAAPGEISADVIKAASSTDNGKKKKKKQSKTSAVP